MGFFSWVTSDTKKSISNIYSGRGTFPVYVLCPDGTRIREDAYEGYGKFGGKDIYALVALWNAPEKCYDEEGNLLPEIKLRKIGLDLKYNGKLKYPIKIVENPNLKYEDTEPSEDCKYQGYFYPDDEDGD